VAEALAAFLHLAEGADRSPRTTRGGSEGDTWRKVETVARCIAENFAKEINTGKIAAAAGLHPKYAMTLLKQRCGVTLHDYLQQHRVRHAQSLLITTDAKLLMWRWRAASALRASFTRCSGE